MKVYVVEMFTDIHNCGTESDIPRVFATYELAAAYAKELWDKNYTDELRADLEQDEFAICEPPSGTCGDWCIEETSANDFYSCAIHACEVEGGAK